MSIVTAQSLAPRRPDIDLDGAQRAYQGDREHVFHSWSAQGALNPMVITAGQGSWLWDGEGQPLLDFSSQMVNTNIGHQHPAVVRGIQEQAGRLCTIAPPYANDARSEAARLIVEKLSRDGLNHVFFTNGGTDAIENAVRMARLHTGRRKVLSRYRSYHGHTQTAIHLTGDPRRWDNDTGSEGVSHFFGPFTYRSAFHASTDDEECARALEHLDQVVQLEGPRTIAAIVLETIPGTPGIMVPPAAYLAGVREICDRYGICWIADEVMAGFGRSGAWFGIDHFRAQGGGQLVPDLVTFAKGVNSGYIPLGGVVISDAIYDTFRDRVYPGGLTYSGHPLACAAAVSTITAMSDEGIVQNAARIGEQVLGPGLQRLAERHEVIGEVRGKGVFWAIELVRDRRTREPLVPYNATGEAAAPMTALGVACRRRGLLASINMNRVHAVPPCIITEDEARLGLDILDDALAECFGQSHS